LGTARPYWGAGFYIKATQLRQPADAIFIEFHSAYNEPEGWFGDEPNKLRSKLGTIAQFKVQQFREKLANYDPAKEDAAAKTGK
jgi:hypothetical protein